MDDGARDSDPISWFGDSFVRAAVDESFDPARAALATVTADGHPSVRFVLVKQADRRGFVFYTNLGSSKAAHLSSVPHAALAFHWSSIGEQVRIEGTVERVDDAQADAYFASRPRGSQIGAWASRQSSPIADRESLDRCYAEVEHRFASAEHIPRPPFWGGYRLVPACIEFWLNRDDRLHDRWLFTRSGSGWDRTRLQP